MPNAIGKSAEIACYAAPMQTVELLEMALFMNCVGSITRSARGFEAADNLGAQSDAEFVYVLMPRALEMSARVAFSASLTCTPPIPRLCGSTLTLGHF